MTQEEAKILEAVRGISIAALNRWKSRPDSTIGKFARAVLEYRKTCFDDQPVGTLLDGDEVVKLICDIAWYNGWVLTYKLEKREDV